MTRGKIFGKCYKCLAITSFSQDIKTFMRIIDSIFLLWHSDGSSLFQGALIVSTFNEHELESDFGKDSVRLGIRAVRDYKVAAGGSERLTIASSFNIKG
jgi:hypothetical protein